jgi:hypothetical protein
MRGGALQRIGSLTPDITDPEKLREKCDILYLAAHANTMANTMFIVPENTFILFKGRSAYITTVTSEENKILGNSPTYFEDMYTAFFKDTPTPGNMEIDTLLRPYPDAYIYTPGDLIHNMNLQFNSELHDLFIRLGYYNLPLDNIYDFILNQNMFTIPTLINITRDYPEKQKLIKIKPKYLDRWNAMKTCRGRQTYPGDIIDYYISNFHNKIPEYDWFQDAETIKTIMDKIISPFAMSGGYRDRNILPLDILNPPTNGKSTLLDILNTYPSEKKYRFIYVTACRPPDLDATGELNTVSHPDPERLPQGTSIARRRVRRASFSVKGPDVTCPLGPGVRPMNLKPIKNLLNEMLGATTFPRKEGSFILYLTTLIFKKEGERYTYNDTITSFDLAQFVDKLYESYPLMESTKPEESYAKEVFTTIFLTTKAIFHGYLSGIAKNVGAANTTIGQLFAQFNDPNTTIEYSDEEKRQILGAMGASMGGRVKRTRKIRKRRKSTRRRK